MLLHASPAVLRADYRDDVGYTKLALELGGALPTGTGIGVTQIEAPVNGTEPYAYLPDQSFAEFAGKTFTVLSNSGLVSGHANAVAQYFFGSSTGMAPGVTSIHNYEANGWLQDDFLQYGSSNPPDAETQRILNASWMGSADSGGPLDVQLLRRFDYAVQQSEFLGVVALNNGDGGNVPALMASSYNGISVGRSDAYHSYGTNTADGGGRTKPDIVAPLGATSYATPVVASAAAMLSQGAPANATKPVTLKAILMAGATKGQFPTWSRTTAHPLNGIYGAGQLNVYNSQHILAAGQQAANSGATVPRTGWDYNTTAGGGRLYFFDVPAGASTMALSTVLTWNRTISGAFPSPSSSLANLTLKLYAASGFTTGALIDSSESAVDNVEHIYRTTLAPGRYALEVTAGENGVAYALAWLSVPVVTISATTPTASEAGPVPGAFTITRGGDTTAALMVKFTISGTATNGTDYATLLTSVTIPPGASSAEVSVAPVADSIVEGNESVVLTLALDPDYVIGTASSAVVTIQDKPFDAWRFAKFTTAELADTSLSGEQADFEKDGIVTLQEYAFGLEPKTMDVAGLPLAYLQPGGALAIAYTRVKSAADIAYTVEVSNDLANWQSGVAFTAVIGTDDHGATETVRVGSLLAPGPSGRQFMRVRATRQ